jgi:hypothetical protein
MLNSFQAPITTTAIEGLSLQPLQYVKIGLCKQVDVPPHKVEIHRDKSSSAASASGINLNPTSSRWSSTTTGTGTGSRADMTPSRNFKLKFRF